MATDPVAAELSQCMALLRENPQVAGNRIADIGKRKGYSYIKDEVGELEKFYLKADVPEDLRAEILTVLTMLRQPEWVWHRDKSKANIYYFGTLGTEGVQIKGQYITGSAETGDVDVYLDKEAVDLGDVTVDPRKMYEPMNVRTKIYKERGRYWLVKIGRIADLIYHGFAKDSIVRTGWKGYFRKVAAYVKFAGPFDDVEKARQAKASTM